jgi:hypothetical protein
MRAKTRATIEDLYKVEGKVELVNGEIVEMPPAGDEPNVAGGEIFAHLRDYVRRTGRGKAYTDGIGFHVNLPHRESFSPDAAYHVGPHAGMRVLEGAPTFAVEVRGEHDYGPAAKRAMAAKRADYFACGTLNQSTQDWHSGIRQSAGRAGISGNRMCQSRVVRFSRVGCGLVKRGCHQGIPRQQSRSSETLPARGDDGGGTGRARVADACQRSAWVRDTQMTTAEILQQAKTLSVQGRKESVKLLVDSLDGPEAVPRQQRRLSELRGLGKEIWEGIDAQEYANQLRSEWDERP